ncbi:DUF4347 domain-containing protein [Phormidium sp. FACHB-592]|uniref:DUF4347 domain-containing protein n=1 Tax=Stenomitos frigidus AS-A4 TaxID=2933935 RepID=A0ABV0KRQ1_9CYAN|nr:DUF4347 domain-containing protein [Phormidium sp. FACHB-592]MBD2075896.1 DUF4347 domain-containing protein [Phormidium sp. FACHB-592]
MKETLGDRDWGTLVLKPVLSVSALLLCCGHFAFGTAPPGCYPIIPDTTTIYLLILVMEAAFSSLANRHLLPTTLSSLALKPSDAISLTSQSDSFLQPSQRSSLPANLVFIDSGISEYQSLLAGVQPGVEVYLLNSAQDAIDQITQILLGRTGLSSLHIVSHGQAGGLALGTDWLNLDNLRSYSGELQSWGNALTADADILLYGCEVGQGVIGQSFVQQLAQLTGADIAASNDLTGNVALGGDWILEVNTGSIEASQAFLATTMQGYSSVLDDAIFASAQQYTGGSLNSTSKTFADGAGNVYTVGAFNGTVDFDLGAGVFTLTSAGHYDIFVSKLDVSGNFVWAKSMGGSGDDRANGVSVDSSGNVYITGSFIGTADFDPGTGTTNLIGTVGDSTFVSKLDASGSFVWAKGIGGTSNGISIDSSGNVYITGSFLSTTDFDPGTGTTSLTSTGGRDIFISKLDTGGNLAWAKRIGGTGDDQTTGISVDSSGNVYTTGVFRGTVDFDPGTGTTNLIGAGGDDIFISKLNADGSLVWAKRIGGTGDDQATGISVDGSGNVHTTGFFSGTVDFNPGTGTTNLAVVGPGSDIFISKLDTNGNFAWAKRTGNGGIDRATGISVDSSGNVYTAGFFSGTVDFDPGTGTTYLESDDFDDIFVSKLDINGNYVWAKSMGGKDPERATGISVDGSGNVHTTGFFFDAADFDPGTGIFKLVTGGTDAPNIFLSKLDAAGNFVRAQQFTDGTLSSSSKTATDGAGNVYTVGAFNGTVDFDPGVGVFTLTSAGSIDVSGGRTDIFVSKSDARGNLIWAKSMGGTASEAANGISVDGSGNVYVIGSFAGIADFDPGTGTTNLTTSGSYSYAVFVSKLDGNGNFVWAKSMDGSGNGISVDGGGNVYTTGTFIGTVDFDPGAGTANLTSAGSNDIFVSKLDASGNFVWAKSMGGSDYDRALVISVDGSGNVHTTGTFGGTADFDPGTGIMSLTSVSNSRDIFVSKLDTNGSFVWAKSIGGSSADFASGISVDSSGNVFITGYFNGTVNFALGTSTTNLISAGGSDIFVSKLDASGSFVWAKSMGGTGDDQATSISMDSSGNVYTTGSFSTTADFDPSTGITNLTSAGGTDIFVNKLDTNGNFVWAKSMGGNLPERANSISVDGSGNVYTTGYLNGTADFDPSMGIFNLVAGGTTNIFLSKLSQVPAPTVSLGTSIATLNEGTSGTTAYIFTVSLSNTSAQAVSVNYTTEDGTATVADNDYTAISGVLTFNPGETSKTITVNVKSDTNIEQDETFLVKLLNPTNGKLAPNASTGTGTITNDDYAQLLWRNSASGENAVWQLNGSTLQSSYYLPTVADANWQIISTADFDRDGNADILWRNQSTGENAIWQLNSTGYQTGYFLTPVADLHWRLLDTGDFNGDGTADLVWRHQVTGENAIWQLNGFSIQTAALITTVADVNWQIVSTADLDNDGKTDLLWRHRVTGENAIWQMNGVTTKSAFLITTVADTNWQVAGTADLNSDGIADLVWRNRVTGENALWQMNSTGLQSGSLITAVADANWQITGVADLGGDRTPDLLWRNAATGQAAIWQLSGFSFLQGYLLPDVASEWSVKPFTLA